MFATGVKSKLIDQVDLVLTTAAELKSDKIKKNKPIFG